MRDITAIVLYCSYDKNFFKTCIDNLLETGIKCIVVSRDILYGGEPENFNDLAMLEEIYQDNPNVTYLHLPSERGKRSIFYEADARYSALTLVSTTYTLFIDIDEIVEPARFGLWLDKDVYTKYIGMKLRVHTYSYSPIHRLLIKAYNTVMCRTSYAKSLPFTSQARLQYFNNNNKISRWSAKLGLNPYFYIYKGTPFIHHYTGARSMENMKKKVLNWSHKDDKPNWLELLKEKHADTGRIWDYKYEIVDNFFNIQM